MWQKFLSIIGEAWRVAFPMFRGDDPSGPSTVTRAAVLREAAKLSEDINAVSAKHTA